MGMYEGFLIITVQQRSLSCLISEMRTILKVIINNDKSAGHHGNGNENNK